MLDFIRMAAFFMLCSMAGYFAAWLYHQRMLRNRRPTDSE